MHGAPWIRRNLAGVFGIKTICQFPIPTPLIPSPDSAHSARSARAKPSSRPRQIRNTILRCVFDDFSQNFWYHHANMHSCTLQGPLYKPENKQYSAMQIFWIGFGTDFQAFIGPPRCQKSRMSRAKCMFLEVAKIQLRMPEGSHLGPFSSPLTKKVYFYNVKSMIFMKNINFTM